VKVDIVGNVKEIADLAKKYNDIEFYRKIVHLEGEVIELTRENRQAEQKIEELQTQLALKIKMKFERPFYYQDGDDVPFCPRCYEKDFQALHLVFMGDGDKSTRWDCPGCNKMYTIQKAGVARRQASSSHVGPWS